jgi:hypothetical protein
MWQMRVSFGTDADLLNLDAQRAGTALACVFSSSDEFEQAVIRARRDAGAYGRSHAQKSVYWGCAIGALIVVLVTVL